MGNCATHQEMCDVVSHVNLEQKSSDFFSDRLASFRVNDKAPIKSLKKSCYSKAKTVWPLPNHEIPFFPEFPIRSVTSEHSFNVISIVSSGAYGKVLCVVHKEEMKNYAMKVMSKNMIFKENLVQQVKIEAQIQVMCDHHPFLVRCPFRWQNKRNLFIVTEFAEGGDLQQLWQETGSFHEDLIKIYVAEIALVLDFLHNAGIIYRDLKMENLLIDGTGHLKLIDFGLSKWLSYGNRCRTLCGTQQYMAPEILRTEPYTHSVDWWALGILFYALLQGKFPFCGTLELPAAMENRLLDFSDNEMDGGSSGSESARRLIRGLLIVDPLKRVRSLRTMKNHAFYHHFDFELLRCKKVDSLPLLLKQREKRRYFPDETASNAIIFD